MSGSLQNKLLGFEAVPPQGAWDKIAAALDEAEEGYAKRLASYAVEPPAGVWTAIDAVLNESAQTAKVISFPSANKRPVLYWAAAAVLAALVVGAFLLFRSGSENVKDYAVTPSGKKTDTTFPSLSAKEAPTVTASTTEEETEKRSKPSPVRRWLSFIRPRQTVQTVSLAGLIPKTAQAQPLSGISMRDDFMVYSDGDGHAMKLPKRLFGLVNCDEGDGSCRERVQRLRQKLTANNTSADFFGMIDQLRELE